jgi:hypothetical protein
VSDNLRFAQTLGFTPQWFALGIINDEILARQRAQWDNHVDSNSEHYRYGAFIYFLKNHNPLTPALAIALYELGANDPDYTMGGSIMAQLIRRPECPQQLLDAALRSDRKYLIQLAKERTHL